VVITAQVTNLPDHLMKEVPALSPEQSHLLAVQGSEANFMIEREKRITDAFYRILQQSAGESQFKCVRGQRLLL